jgi:hypothetical protein
MHDYIKENIHGSHQFIETRKMHFHIEDTNVLHSYAIAGVCTLHKEDLSESLEAQEQRGLVANALGTIRPFHQRFVRGL